MTETGTVKILSQEQGTLAFNMYRRTGMLPKHYLSWLCRNNKDFLNWVFGESGINKDEFYKGFDKAKNENTSNYSLY